MNKCIVFYFSGTGNTAWASRKLAGVLSHGDLETIVFNIENLDPKDVKKLAAGCGWVGFCYPVYGSDLPQPMKDFLRELPSLGKRTYFGLCTQELFSGDGVRAMLPFLRTSQGKVALDYAIHIRMPNNISIEKYGFRVINNPQKLNRIFIRAELKIGVFGEAILAGQKIRKGLNPGSRLLGAIQRVPYRLMYPLLMNSFSVDHTKCNECGICRKICPAGNISETFDMGNYCFLCLRCYNYCPNEAVLYRRSRAKGKAYQGPEGYLTELIGNHGKEQE